MKGAQSALLQLKTDPWLRLPWCLAVLADADEEFARSHCPRIWESFNKDPRPPPVHDEVTWFYLGPGSDFRIGFLLFKDGTARWLCGVAFLEGITRLKLMALGETTIEEKHARVTIEQEGHAIGPVSVSLANRSPPRFTFIAFVRYTWLCSLLDVHFFNQETRSQTSAFPL